MVTSERWWKIVQIVHDALVIVFLPILFPVLCVLGFRYNRREKEKRLKEREERKKPWPGALRHEFLDPRSNESVLTLPLEPVPGMTYQKATAAQTDCLLLTKLPKELRDMIWEECLGKKAIHLTMTRDCYTDPVKLVSFICCSFEDIQHRECLGGWRLEGGEYWHQDTPDDDGKDHHIKILYTCRKM
jgi:hypothetical protein